MNALATQTPTFIPVCCVCGLAREGGASAGCTEESWTDFDVIGTGMVFAGRIIN